jgi:hypothetical protein
MAEKTVYVTRTQSEAAQLILKRAAAKGTPASAAVKAIAEARTTKQPATAR